jgi:hypothetical protein
MSVTVMILASGCSVVKTDESICAEYDASLSQYLYDFGFGAPDPRRHINVLGGLADQASGELKAALLKDQSAVPVTGLDLPTEHHTAKVCEGLGFYIPD